MTAGASSVVSGARLSCVTTCGCVVSSCALLPGSHQPRVARLNVIHVAARGGDGSDNVAAQRCGVALPRRRRRRSGAQRGGDGQRARALLRLQTHVAAAEGQAVRLSHQRRPNHAHADVQVTHHAAQQLELLVIFAPKHLAG